MKNNLILFTLAFPYGKGETFIENEIKYLSKSFNKIYIFPLDTNFDSKRKIPGNLEIIDLVSYHKIRNVSEKNWVIKSNKLWIIKLLLEDLFNKDAPLFFDFRQRLISIKWTIIRAKILKNWLRENEIKNAIFYSYWFHTWALILSILKNFKIINFFVSRAHRYDLYSERRSISDLQFQKYQIKHIGKLYLISKHGLNYLSSKFPKYSEKLHLSYLGTQDYGFNTMTNPDLIHLVSISGISPVKRVHLIIEILSFLEMSVKWTHIGNGSLNEIIRKKAEELPLNISTNFKGQIKNKEVINFLKYTPITVFINVSESEGLPVSIMEAISFGIPIVATNVGGTGEIVNSNTGILIPEDFNAKTVAMTIGNHIMLFNNKKYRMGVRTYWEKQFNGKTNYKDFIDSIQP